MQTAKIAAMRSQVKGCHTMPALAEAAAHYMHEFEWRGPSRCRRDVLAAS